MTAQPHRLVFLGVDATTGAYLRPPVELGQPKPRRRVRIVKAGVSPQDLSQAGWGVVFAPGTPSRVREALGELLALRQEQAGELFRVDEIGKGESAEDYFLRHRVGPGAADPARLPYYLLLVGDPEAISFDLQYRLDVQRAVGRLWFRTADEYARYAAAVVASEREQGKPPVVAVFAPEHPDDGATRLSSSELAQPLLQTLATSKPGFQIFAKVGQDATKEALARLLTGAGPSLLFTAGHALGYPAGHEDQLARQGAILTQEWAGPLRGHGEPVKESESFAAADLSAQADLRGTITFHFACYSAGTPRWSSFAHLDGKRRKTIAPEAFVAALPRKLLAQGALAVIGHIDQAWQHSFSWFGAGGQLQTFESTLLSLLEGQRVGAAMEYFAQRYAEIATQIAARLEPRSGLAKDPNVEMTALWVAGNDARSYVVLGDPAVRLRQLTT